MEKTMKARGIKRRTNTKSSGQSQKLQPTEAKYLKELQQRDQFYCPNPRKKKPTFPFHHRDLFE
jgi:hypothetical protein